MVHRYPILFPATQTADMGAEFVGCMVVVLFYDAGGNPVVPSGVPIVEKSSYAGGGQWKPVEMFAAGEWRCNGYIERIRLNLTGVTGYADYRAEVIRMAEPIPMIPDGAFTGLRGIITQPYTEANVKTGRQFYLRAAWPKGGEIAAGSTAKIWFSTGASPVIVKSRVIEFDAEELKVGIFSGPAGVTGGTTITPRNYNRVNPVLAVSQCKKNVSTTTDGTAFDPDDPEYLFGASNSPQRTPGAILQGRERVLPANTEFIVAITNTGSNIARVQYFLDWYQGETDLPLAL